MANFLFQAMYLVKWKNYPFAHNEWVVADECNCDDLISRFEASDIIGILGENISFFLEIESFRLNSA